jgi:hypothetical protein
MGVRPDVVFKQMHASTHALVQSLDAGYREAIKTVQTAQNVIGK